MSLFDRFIARRRPWWVTLLIFMVLLVIPLAAIALDGAWKDVVSLGLWRPVLLAPVVISYVLAVAPAMAKSSADMLEAFRPLVKLDGQAFDQQVRGSSRIRLAGEMLAMAAGGLVGLLLGLTWLRGIQTAWLRLYAPASLSLLIGLLGWTIYDSFASTGPIEALHRHPLKLNILDIRPFEPVGRYSLAASLVFMGGITLGILFGLDVQNVWAWQTWLFFLPLMSVPAIVFFLNMRPTHRLLATEKKRQLQVVGEKLLRLSRALQRRINKDDDEGLGAMAGEFTALAAYEARLRAAPTWPYNTAMLRTLGLTIFVPLVVRGLSLLLFGQ
jgi:hypothetical protein